MKNIMEIIKELNNYFETFKINGLESYIPFTCILQDNKVINCNLDYLLNYNFNKKPNNIKLSNDIIEVFNFIFTAEESMGISINFYSNNRLCVWFDPFAKELILNMVPDYRKFK